MFRITITYPGNANPDFNNALARHFGYHPGDLIIERRGEYAGHEQTTITLEEAESADDVLNAVIESDPDTPYGASVELSANPNRVPDGPSAFGDSDDPSVQLEAIASVFDGPEPEPGTTAQVSDKATLLAAARRQIREKVDAGDSGIDEAVREELDELADCLLPASRETCRILKVEDGATVADAAAALRRLLADLGMKVHRSFAERAGEVERKRIEFRQRDRERAAEFIRQDRLRQAAGASGS